MSESTPEQGTPLGQKPGEVTLTAATVDPNVPVITDSKVSDDLLAGLDPSIVAGLS